MGRAFFIGVIMLYKNGKVDLDNPTERNEVGDEIHAAWLLRNDWAKNDELDIPFDELPEFEQAKDIDQMRIALNQFGLDS